MKSQTIVVIVLLTVIICLIAYMISYIPRNISVEMQMVEFNMNDKDAGIKYGTIRIEGSVKSPFFRIPTYSGEVVISTQDFTEKYKLLDTLLFDYIYIPDTYSASLVYWNSDTSSAERFSHAYISKAFDKAVIPVGRYKDYLDINVGDYYGLTIVAPAQSIDDAITMANQFPH